MRLTSNTICQEAVWVTETSGRGGGENYSYLAIRIIYYRFTDKVMPCIFCEAIVHLEVQAVA
jgi:hypothetical protein